MRKSSFIQFQFLSKITGLSLLFSIVSMTAGMCQGYPFNKAKSRGFSIPQIDLNDSLSWQTIADIDSTLYLGHPTSFVTNVDEITMMYLTGHAVGNMKSVKSFDGGLNWQDSYEFPEEWNEAPDTFIYNDYMTSITRDGYEYPNNPFTQVPTIYELESDKGDKKVFMYMGVYTGRAGANFPARYGVLDLENRCAGWSELRALTFGGKTISPNVLFADMIRLKNGNYLGTFHFDDGGEKRKTNWNNGKVFTAITKNGYEFTEPKVTAQYPGAFLCEAGLIRSPDGSSIAMLMRENNRVYNSFISFSKDEGETWSDPVQLPDALTGDRHQAILLKDNRIFISFRDMGVESPSMSDWVGWVGTFDDLLQGKEGEYRIRFKDNLYKNDCAYPTMHLLNNGDIFLATYGHWKKDQPPYILSYKFNIEELDQLKGK